ncbi:hypothetical protein BD408DRAFT_422380 [Parasitella parasitica]|nr:hypothetical protein BD408DRAFT_422380 [Parasitella parasitica]
MVHYFIKKLGDGGNQIQSKVEPHHYHLYILSVGCLLKVKIRITPAAKSSIKTELLCLPFTSSLSAYKRLDTPYLHHLQWHIL